MKTDRAALLRPLGLYLHIPFCLQKCRYCDFLSAPAAPAVQERYLAALRREIELTARCPDIAGRRFVTLYVGGGTPTALPPAALAEIIALCLRSFSFSGDGADGRPEVTVEANPGTVASDGLARLKDAGVNRLSLGVQAFDDRLLRILGRIHTAQDARVAFAAARAAGFSNINIDLMFGLPEQTLAAWEQTLAEAIALGPEHISTYSLIVEEGTPFGELAARGELALPDEETEAEQYERAIGRLTAAGYRHYEISNFARPGCETRHNLIYWHNEEYLGLGLGAWSYIARQEAGGLVRDANPLALETYCAALERGGLPPREGGEAPSRRREMIETAIMGLRLIDGIDLSAFAERFGVELDKAFPGVRARLAAEGLAETADGRLRLTGRGVLLANRAWAHFV